MVYIKKKLATSEHDEDAQKRALLGIQDEFQARGFELVAWTERHKNTLLTCISILVIGGLLWTGYYFFTQSVNSKVSVAYQNAVELLNTQQNLGQEKTQISQARDAFKKVWTDFGHSSVGNLAQLQGAILSMDLGDDKEAVELYNSFLRVSNKDNELRSLALNGLGFAYANLGDKQKALNTFDEMINSHTEAMNDVVFWQAGKLAISLNQKARAQKYLEQLTQRFPTSQYIADAQRLMSN